MFSMAERSKSHKLEVIGLRAKVKARRDGRTLDLVVAGLEAMSLCWDVSGALKTAETDTTGTASERCWSPGDYPGISRLEIRKFPYVYSNVEKLRGFNDGSLELAAIVTF